MADVYYRQSEVNLTFLDAFFGLVLNPSETTRALFERKTPPYLFSFLLGALIVSFGPTVYYIWKNDAFRYADHRVLSMALIAAITLAVFVTFEHLLLTLLRVDTSPPRVLACTAYTLAPFATALLISYVASFVMTGKISFIYLLMGTHVPSDRFISFLPWVFLVGQIDMLLVLIFSIRSMTEIHFFSATCIGMLSVIPLYVAVIVALIAAEAALPGSKQAFFDLLGGPHGVLTLRT